jgi:hypothetical protein
MIATISTTLNASADRVAQLVQRSDTLIYISGPLIRFVPIRPGRLPEVWSPGEYRVSMRFLGILPLGEQSIRIEHRSTDQPGTFSIRDKGGGQLVRVWDHVITIGPDVAGGRTRYEDRVEVRAGLLTPFIWLFALGFYRWRQHRWKQLLRRSGGGACGDGLDAPRQAL